MNSTSLIIMADFPVVQVPHEARETRDRPVDIKELAINYHHAK